jgi:large subunit ribosomal protein L4
MKTKELALALTRVGANGKSVLVVEEGALEIARIGRNIKDLKVLGVMDLNVYDLLWCDKLVITKSEVQRIQEVWVKI